MHLDKQERSIAGGEQVLPRKRPRDQQPTGGLVLTRQRNPLRARGAGRFGFCAALQANGLF